MQTADPELKKTETVDLQTAFDESGVREVIDQLDHELVGLAPVKARIREIAALLLVDKLRRDLGLTSEAPTLHMSFTGNPGTGKTTVALKNYRLSAAAEDAFRGYIAHRMSQPHFANARSIRNALDRARLRQATRLFESRSRELTADDLMTIDAEEILASRVFDGGIDAPSGEAGS